MSGVKWSVFLPIYILNINLSEWNIGIYCIQGRNISRGRRPRKIFSTEGTIICRYFTRKGFEYLVYYIGFLYQGTTVSVATYPLTMRSIRGGTLGWNIEIYSTPTNQFDWSVSRAYVINIYICLVGSSSQQLRGRR